MSNTEIFFMLAIPDLIFLVGGYFIGRWHQAAIEQRRHDAAAKLFGIINDD